MTYEGRERSGEDKKRVHMLKRKSRIQKLLLSEFHLIWRWSWIVLSRYRRITLVLNTSV